MGISLFYRCQRLLQLLLLLVLLLTLALLPQSSCQNDDFQPVCRRERVTAKINLEGCETAETFVWACSGSCISAVSTVLLPPFQEMHCTSCRPTRFYNKPRRIDFTCNGQIVRKRMYFPFVQECGCVNTTSSG